MQCNCGGETVERTVTKNYEPIVWYLQCRSCGRCLITKGARGGSCRWEPKGHKMCVGGCDNGCQRQKDYE